MSSNVTTKVQVDKRTLRKIDHMSKLKGKHGVKVGLPLGTGFYPKTGVAVIDVGLWHEFGTKTLPERSFLRSAISENHDSYKKLNRANLKLVQQRNLTMDQALGRLGAEAQADVVAKIDALPLVDTGLLKQSIKHVVLE